MKLRPVVLCILDGWGDGPSFPGNAIEAADTPTMDRLRSSYPLTELKCSGRDVGLPDGQMGNSEVGHLNLGAGYVVNQWITQIDLTIEDGSFFTNPVLLATTGQAKTRQSALHLMGLVSDGGVHSHQRHLTALLRMAHQQSIERVFVHVFTDGRDTPPESGIGFVKALLDDMSEIGSGKIATVSGRYFAMDRDRRWDRAQKAYDAIVCGEGQRAQDPIAAIRASYEQGVTDEFIVPTVIEQGGEPVATIGDDDCLIFFNFRADRARQLSQALSEPSFSGFGRCRFPGNLDFATMTEYEPDLNLPVAFPPHNVDLPVARVISEAGMKQFHTAETEKYAHVTYFFNGGREEPFAGEDRKLVPSPKVATYDLQPEMSAIPLTDGVVEAIEGGRYDFVIINYANGDMVGHTGVFSAAVKAVETVDSCLKRVVDAVLSQGGAALVTADHGNAEEMLVPGTDEVWTAHTKNRVPLLLITPDGSPLRHVKLRGEGRLADVAPTILDLLGIQQPDTMTGQTLIDGDASSRE